MSDQCKLIRMDVENLETASAGTISSLAGRSSQRSDHPGWVLTRHDCAGRLV